MIVDPNKIVGIGAVKLEAGSKIQQSGIDLTIWKIRRIESSHADGTIIYGEELQLPAVLRDNSAYDITFHEYVQVPNNMVAQIIIRSSFNRRGAYLTTGLYDNGFRNFAGGVLHTTIPFRIEQNERLAQIVFYETEHNAVYSGQYQDKSSNAGSTRADTLTQE